MNSSMSLVHYPSHKSIIILSTYGSEFLPFLLAELEKTVGLQEVGVLLDGEIKEKDKRIVVERTAGFFEWPKFSSIEKYEVPLFVVENHNGEKSQELLRKIQPELILNGGTPRILKQPLFSLASHGILNVHPGILPKYRGCTCVEWALYNDDPVGATCHFMDEGIDTGPIVYVKEMAIQKGEIYEQVRAHMIQHTAQVLANGTQMVVEKNMKITDVAAQEGGQYFHVISEKELQIAKERLAKQEYSHYAT